MQMAKNAKRTTTKQKMLRGAEAHTVFSTGGATRGGGQNLKLRHCDETTTTTIIIII